MNQATQKEFDGVQITAQAIEDVMNILYKIVNNENAKNFKNLKEDLKGDTGYVTGIDDAMYAKTVKMLEQAGIPYFSYDVVGSTRQYIFVAAKHEDEIKAIVNKARIIYGYSIDTKRELDEALTRTELSPKEKVYSNLKPELAQKMMEYCDKHNVTAVTEKNEDGTYSLYCAEKDGEKMNRFLYSAAWCITGKSGEIEGKRLNYMVKEKEEINEALSRVDIDMPESYVFSATSPGSYLHISRNGFEYVKNGVVSAQMRASQNPEDYSEILKFQINRLDNAVYMPAQEVASKGGPESDTVKKEVQDSLFRGHLTKEDGYTIQAEKELRNFIENKYKIGPDENLKDAKENMGSLNMKDFEVYFAQKCRRDTPEREAYYNRVMSHTGGFENHIRETEEILRSVEEKTIYVEKPFMVAMETLDRETEKQKTTTHTQTQTQTQTQTTGKEK